LTCVVRGTGVVLEELDIMEEVLVADTYAARRAEQSRGPPGQMTSRSGNRLLRVSGLSTACS